MALPAHHAPDVPDNIRTQARDARTLHEQVYGKKGEAPPSQPSQAPASEQPPEQPPAQAAEPPLEQPPVQAAAEQQEQQERPGEPPNWEHRYKTVQGMMSSQQQKHQRELVDIRNQMANQNLLIQELRRNHVAPPGAPPQQAPGQPRYVTPDEVADYGEEMIGVMRRAAREAVEPELQQVREQVQVTAVDRMYQQLERAVPNYQQLDTDAGFLRWLGEIDPYSGQRRQDMLNIAATNLEAPRVIAFFKGYLDQTAAVAPQTRAGNGGTQARSPQVPIQNLVAPGRPQSPTGQSVPQSNGRQWTRAQVAAFYDDIRKGVYVARPEERTRLEQDLFAAAREGRVQ